MKDKIINKSADSKAKSGWLRRLVRFINDMWNNLTPLGRLIIIPLWAVFWVVIFPPACLIIIIITAITYPIQSKIEKLDTKKKIHDLLHDLLFK